MSKEEKPNLDLSGLDFGPSWAKDKAPARDYSKEVGPRDRRDSRGGGGDRRGGGGGNDRRNNDRRTGGGGGAGGQNRDRRDQRSSGGGGGGDRRQGDRRQGDRRQGDRRQGDRRERVAPTPAPEGFVAGVMPVEEGLDNLAREIKGGGRTYSVFDLARVVMGARERFNVTFEAPKGTTFFRCKSDGSLWLTKEEAIAQFWQANLLDELYEEVTETIDAPKGNFTAVAKCGLSGEWLGPPNYHGYPTKVAQIHAERFANMSLEDYKRRIRNESGEEAVNAWLESQTSKVSFRPLSTEEILALRETRKAAADAEVKAKAKAPEPEPAEEAKAEAAPEVVVTTETAPEEPAADATEAPAIEEVETPAEEAPEAATTEEEAPEGTAPAEKEEPKLLADRREVERHFSDHHFKHLFAEVERAWVPGNIPAKLLSPGFLTLLKDIVAEERRYPSKLTPILCRQLSGRHLAVFKYQKKLKAGPARPHAIPDDLTLAERPSQLLAWIEANNAKNLDELWKGCLPEGADEELKRNYYHDLHWLLNQGYVLLMADGTIHLAKGRAADQPAKQEQKPKKKATKKGAKPKAESSPEKAPSEKKESSEGAPETKPEATPSEPTPPAEQADEPKATGAEPSEVQPPEAVDPETAPAEETPTPEETAPEA